MLFRHSLYNLATIQENETCVIYFNINSKFTVLCDEWQHGLHPSSRVAADKKDNDQKFRPDSDRYEDRAFTYPSHKD